MESLLHIGAVLILLTATLLFSQWAAYHIAVKNYIKRKPFNCDACLTFWITALLLNGALAGLDLLTLDHVLYAIIFAFINFFYIKTKITIYD